MEYIKNTTDYLTNPEFAARVDQQVLSGCTKQRPDIYIDLGDRILIIEIDEHQHRHMDVDCERTRMFDIAQALGGVPVIFIRFNPDDYKTTSGMLDTDTRLHLLVRKMEDIKENWYPEMDVDASLSMAWCTYMFYDDCDDQILRVK
jgi:Holliday junction resolvase